jgi:hypothetical protein
MRILTVSRMWNNKFYCWTYLLFSNKHVWIQQGFSHLNHFSSSQQRHSKSQNLVHRYLQLKLCRKQQRVDLFFDAQHKNDVTKPNEQVKKNSNIPSVYWCCVFFSSSRTSVPRAMMSRPRLETKEISWYLSMCWKIMAKFLKISGCRPWCLI